MSPETKEFLKLWLNSVYRNQNCPATLLRAYHCLHVNERHPICKEVFPNVGITLSFARCPCSAYGDEAVLKRVTHLLEESEVEE
jgi:hypothetical protein